MKDFHINVIDARWPEGAFLISDKTLVGRQLKTVVLSQGFGELVAALDAGKGGELTLA